MREIKFRAWSKNHKRWYDRVMAGCNSDGNDYICNLVWSDEDGDWVNFDEFCGDIAQYTGLKDKNGVEIYEGDVVRNSSGEVGIIEYGNGMFVSRFISPYDWDPMAQYDGNLSGQEVIGNIYEQSHLRENPKPELPLSTVLNPGELRSSK